MRCDGRPLSMCVPPPRTCRARMTRSLFAPFRAHSIHGHTRARSKLEHPCQALEVLTMHTGTMDESCTIAPGGRPAHTGNTADESAAGWGSGQVLDGQAALDALSVLLVSPGGACACPPNLRHLPPRPLASAVQPLLASAGQICQAAKEHRDKVLVELLVRQSLCTNACLTGVETGRTVRLLTMQQCQASADGPDADSQQVVKFQADPARSCIVVTHPFALHNFPQLPPSHVL